MTREEAAEFLEKEKGICEKMLSRIEKAGIKPNRSALDALAVALSTLRPVSREQVEKAEWIWGTGCGVKMDGGVNRNEI